MNLIGQFFLVSSPVATKPGFTIELLFSYSLKKPVVNCLVYPGDCREPFTTKYFKSISVNGKGNLNNLAACSDTSR